MISVMQAASICIEPDPEMQNPDVDQELPICQKFIDKKILPEVVRNSTSIVSSDTFTTKEVELPPQKRTVNECVNCIEKCIEYMV